ncbi:hypothetical protein CY34DRAFT_796926 [Suillus luteus UH-Slu-Lm8-n1]|uniref:Uncharacterized protein n=1 Tax=Suillus luteus UH-Slu-Lm8-n1 TaxID=930992 RepID=A0A0D0AHF4_9AGAM|nr:hypothetical protein CY34DRAFT_796926 [Suillus luteus UH-Slu-Lm8-n1]
MRVCGQQVLAYFVSALDYFERTQKCDPASATCQAQLNVLSSHHPEVEDKLAIELLRQSIAKPSKPADFG